MAMHLVSARRGPREETTIEPRDERRLAELAKAGDEDAFAELVRGRADSVVAFLRRMLGDTEDARDVAQLTFLRVWENLPRYDPTFAFSTWLFRIAGNAAIDHLRRRKVRPLPLEIPVGEDGESRVAEPRESRPDPLEDLTRRRLREALAAAIDRLPDDYRELISLRHYGEMPYEEIAELKGMPLGTVKNKLFRARQALRDLLPKDIV